MIDVQASLRIVEDNKAVFLTKKITGFLEHITVESSDFVNLLISVPLIKTKNINNSNSELLLKLDNFVGIERLPVRAMTVSSQKELLNYSQCKYALNEQVLIIIEGKNNAEVNVSLRINQNGWSYY